MALLVTPVAPNLRHRSHLSQVVCTNCTASLHVDTDSPRLRRLVHGLARVHKCVGS